MSADYRYNRQLEEADEAQVILERLVEDINPNALCDCELAFLNRMDWHVVDYEFAKYHYSVDIEAECPECGMDHTLYAYNEANFEPY